MTEEEGYSNYEDNNTNTKIRDLEEKQRLLKERLTLIGKNLIELKEENSKKTIEIKKQMETLNQNMERTISFLDSLSREFPKLAKKEELEILTKQLRMLQP